MRKSIFTPQKKRPSPDQYSGNIIRKTHPPTMSKSSYECCHTPFSPNQATRESKNAYIRHERHTESLASDFHIQQLQECLRVMELQIQELGLYLDRSEIIQKNAIRRIFNLRQFHGSGPSEEKIIKELGNKVKRLIEQNHRLKSSMPCDRKYSDLHSKREAAVEESLLRQNARLSQLLEEYKRSQYIRENKLLQENKRLREELENIVSSQRELELQLRIFQDNEASNLKKQSISVARESYQELAAYKTQFAQQINNVSSNYERSLQKLRERIEHLEEQEKKCLNKLEQFRFERRVRAHSTLKKSKNFAELSPPAKGDQQLREPSTEEYGHIPFRFSDEKDNCLELERENQRLKRLVGQQGESIQCLRKEISMKQGQLHQKITRILTLENEVQNGRGNKSMNYLQEIRNIREHLLSCNVNNFEQFSRQMQQIISQRNEMNQKVYQLKEESTAGIKAFELQSTLKIEKERYRQLENRYKELEKLQILTLKENEELKKEIIKLKKDLQQFRFEVFRSDAKLVKELQPDGKAGLEWQKLVKECIMTSAQRLELLEEKIKNPKNSGISLSRVHWQHPQDQK